MRKNFSVFINNKIKKFNANISKIPGCKSTSFRALIFSSQAIGISHLKGVLESDDIKCCIKSLKDLGVKIVKIKSGEYKIYGNGENSYTQFTPAGKDTPASTTYRYKLFHLIYLLQEHQPLALLPFPNP